MTTSRRAPAPADTSAGGVSPDAAAAIRRMLWGVRLSQSISVAASLGVPDLLAAGPKPVEELADATGAETTTLYRLLRTLAAADVLHEGDGRTFSLTELGTALRTDLPGSVHAQAIVFGRPYMLAAWGNLEHSIRTGQNAFLAQYGEDIWSWRARQPGEESAFNRAMSASNNGRSIPSRSGRTLSCSPSAFATRART